MRGVFLLVLLLASARAGEPVAVVRLEWETGALAGTPSMKVTPKEPVDLGGGRRLAVALEEGRFRCDRNLDGSLADEKPVDVPAKGKAWDYQPTVRAGDLELAVRFYLSPNCSRDHVHFVPLTHLRGEVVLAGRLRKVAVDRSRLLIDLNGDEAFDPASEAVGDGEPFRARGEVFEARRLDDVVEFRASGAVPERKAPTWRPLSFSRYNLARKDSHATLDKLIDRFNKESRLEYAKRLPTLRAIAALDGKETFEFLFDTVRNGTEHTSIRSEAMRAMGREAFKPYVRRIAYVAGSPRDPQRAEIACQLLHLHDYAEREAIYRRVLEGGKGVAVRGAAAGLVLLGKPAAVERLVREGTDKNTRAFAYYGLRFGAQPPPADLVRAALTQDDPLLRSYALPDLARIDPEQARLRALGSVEFARGNLTVAYQVADILGRWGDAESVRALFSIVPGAHPNLLERIRRALGPVRDEGATEIYIRALRVDHAGTRAMAANLLANLPGRKTTDALHKRIRREHDPEVMQALLEAIGEHRDPKSISTLLKLAKHKEPAIRLSAMQALARIGPGIRQVKSFFLRLLKSKRWEDRVFALDVAGDVGNPDLAPMILENLDHKRWQVRDAAVEALGKLRVRDAVLPLIKRLELEDVQRVRAAIARTLFVTTGMNLYDFAETWKKWWLEHGASFKVPEEIPQRRRMDAGGTMASFYGLPLDSGRVTFVIDKSGSMSSLDRGEATRLETAVAETLGAVGRLKPRDQVNVVFFDGTVHAWQKKLVALTASNRAELGKHLERQNPGGSTNVYDALEFALKDKNVDTIFLLSDGSPTAGRYTSAPDILRAVDRLNQARRIAIHCVSVGTESDLLKKLAAANAGEYVRR